MRLPSLGALLCATVIGACAHPSGSNAEAMRQAKTIVQRKPSTLAKIPASESASSRELPIAERMNAQANALRDSYYRCVASNDGSTWEMQECIEAEFVYQDGRLNYAYRTLRSMLSHEGAKKLRDEERLWLSDRNASCKWNAETEGQAQRIEANECSLETTAKRADQLEDQLRELGKSL